MIFCSDHSDLDLSGGKSLRLKGRIFLRDVESVTQSIINCRCCYLIVWPLLTALAEYALLISWRDRAEETLQHFTLKVHNKAACEQWMEHLLASSREGNDHPLLSHAENTALGETKARGCADESYWIS